jgi:hypothetical protein
MHLPVKDRARIDSKKPAIRRIFDFHSLIAGEGVFEGSLPFVWIDVQANLAATREME